MGRAQLVEDTAARADWEARLDINKWRVRQLREEESAASDLANVAPDKCDARSTNVGSRAEAVRTPAQDVAAALRIEIELLAQEVAAAATDQMSHRHSIRKLRAAAGLAKTRRAARVAVEE